MTFRATLRQDIAYFDHPKNNTGALCTRLATEASAVQGATGIRIGITIKNVVTLGGGVIISFVFSWQLTLLILAFIPFIVASGFLQNQLITGSAAKNKEAEEDAGKVCQSFQESHIQHYKRLCLTDSNRINSKY